MCDDEELERNAYLRGEQRGYLAGLEAALKVAAEVSTSYFIQDTIMLRIRNLIKVAGQEVRP